MVEPAWWRELPHRPPFLLLDELEVDAAGQRVTAHWRPDPAWEVFAGHFPDDPVVPGVLLVEAMAQAACVLGRAIDPSTRDLPVLLAGIDRARFRRPVRPGETVRIEVLFRKRRRGLWRFEGRAFVDQDLAAEATLLAALQEDLAP